ncbi:hypothetical protein ACWD9K_33645 [Streptomyces sp. 900116325]
MDRAAAVNIGAVGLARQSGRRPHDIPAHFPRELNDAFPLRVV